MYNVQNLTTLYVSQAHGNDNNQGFFADPARGVWGPVQTIERALFKITEMRAIGALQPLTIRITDDVYRLNAPIVIDGRMRDITIEPQKKTLISGGIEVRNFVRDSFNDVDCLSADLSAYGDLHFSDFYVNGQAKKLPRYPETGTLDPESVENDNPVLWASSKWFIARREDIEVLRNFRNMEDWIISFRHCWIDEHTPVDSIDWESGRVEFKYASRFSISMQVDHRMLHYFIENVGECFKNPGEWYYDRETKKLYYIPEDDNAAELTGYIPVTDKLICVRGSADCRAHGVHIRGFDMAYTKGEYRSAEENRAYPKYNDVGYAGDKQSVCDAHGSVEFEYAHNCSIEDCRLWCLGVHGIVVRNGSERIRIRRCDLSQLGAGAISVNGGAFGSDESEHTRRIEIADNRIDHCGNRYSAACGILIRHAYENTIEHNDISWVYYTGISCGWVWGYADSICRDNTIEKNHIHDIGQGVLSDMGGIYLLGKQPGTVVRGNLIHDIKSAHYGGWALYTDEGSSYITLEGNVCYNTSDNSYHQHYGNMNTVRNNIFAFSGMAPVSVARVEMHPGIIAERNIVVVEPGQAAFAVGPRNEGGFNGAGHILPSSENIIFDPTGAEIAAVKAFDKAYTLEEMGSLLRMDIDSVAADPGFADLDNRDFTMSEDSPACEKGFKRIDLSDVGARR